MRVPKRLVYPASLVALIVVGALYLTRDLLPGASSEAVAAAAALENAGGDAQQTTAPQELKQRLGTQVAPHQPEPLSALATDGNEAYGIVAGPDTGHAPSQSMAQSEVPKGGPVSGEGADYGDTEEPSVHGVTLEQVLQTWKQARIAAWRGDDANSIDYYQAVVTLQPDNFDAYGEMGNVMLRSGDRQGAAEAYYQAARLLSKTPYQHAAWNLLHLIAELDRQKAEKLFQELLEQSQPQ